MSIFEFFHRLYLFLYPIYFSKIFLLRQRERISLLDRLEQIWRWTHLEFWEKIEDNAEFMLSSAPVSHFGHNLLLKIPIDSGLIIFFKGNSILYNFYINRENQISMFSRPKLRFKLLWKIMTFFEHFSVFWIFHRSYLHFFFQKSR